MHDYFALLMTVSALLGKQMSHFDDNIALWLEKLFVILQSNEVSEEILCRLKAMSTSVVEDLSS
ncbi:hypothetical protein JCM19233_6292 [Vibrio astriarenae]|nr:hypothetical protein JCM19233_6292 [Vibrio sp. C7]